MTVKSEQTPSFFPKLDAHFKKNERLYFYASLIFLLLFGILLFDVKPSTGEDDAGYLLSAKKFMENKAFPTYHGAFYSILMGIVMKIAGFHIVLFKALSLLFLAGHQILLFYTLRNRVSPFILGTTLIIVSICSGYLYFGSQTYSESLFLLLQGFLLFHLVHYIYDRPNRISDIRISWYRYLILGLLLFLVAITRNIGVIALFAIVFVFLVEKRFIQAVLVFVSFLMFNIPYGIYRKVVWSVKSSDMSTQIEIMMRKNPYNKALGTEDFSGFLLRVSENLKNYLSKIFLKEIGLKDIANNDSSLFITILILAILTLGLVLSFVRKDRVMKLLFVYVGMFLGAMFIALHQMWGQARMIIVFLPLMILTLIWSFGAISRINKLHFVKYIAIVLLAVVFFKSILITSKKASDHQEVLSKNLKGNRYYGYTPDWVSFLKMSEWSAKKVDKSVMIASRKPSMSFIYGKGREFFPIYRLPVEYADSVMAVVESSEKQVYFIKENDFRSKPAGLAYAVKSNMYAGISANNVLYGVYLVDEHETNMIDQVISQLNIVPITSAREFRKNVLAKTDKTTAINPDLLVERLRDNKVQYIIVGNLRVNPKMKTDRTVNTVARYIATMQLKYPGIVSQVHQIGRNEQEPARLYKVNFPPKQD